MSIAFHLGHDLRLVGRVGKECEDSFHTVSVVGLYYVIFLKRTKLQRLLTEALPKLVIVVVQLLELVVNNLHVLRVVEVNVHLLAILLFSLLSACGLLSLIVVLDDIGQTGNTATLFVRLQDAQLLRHSVSFREATKDLSESGILPVESVEVVEDLVLGHISELREDVDLFSTVLSQLAIMLDDLVVQQLVSRLVLLLKVKVVLDLNLEVLLDCRLLLAVRAVVNVTQLVIDLLLALLEEFLGDALAERISRLLDIRLVVELVEFLLKVL